MRVGLCLLVMALGEVTASSPARAQTAREKVRATALLKDGARLMEQKEYAAALQKYEEAYATVASAKIQFNLGLANEGLGRPARALRAFEAYLAGAVADARERRADATTHVNALRSRVGWLSITADAVGATVRVDGEQAGVTPLDGPVAVDPGHHQVVVEKPDAPPFARTIDAVAGERLEVAATLASAPPREVASAPAPDLAPSNPSPDAMVTATETEIDRSPPVYRKGWFWGLVGAAVVGGVVTAVLLTRQGSSFNSLCATPDCGVLP